MEGFAKKHVSMGWFQRATRVFSTRGNVNKAGMFEGGVKEEKLLFVAVAGQHIKHRINMPVSMGWLHTF